MNACRLSSARSWRALAIGLLALALLVAQALGVLHRVEHGSASPVFKAAGDTAGAVADPHVMARVAPAQVIEIDDDGRLAVERLGAGDRSGGTEGDSGHDCAAFDHATVADAAPLPVAPPLGDATPGIGHAPAAFASALAAQAAGYLARGPPAA